MNHDNAVAPALEPSDESFAYLSKCFGHNGVGVFCGLSCLLSSAISVKTLKSSVQIPIEGFGRSDARLAGASADAHRLGNAFGEPPRCRDAPRRRDWEAVGERIHSVGPFSQPLFFPTDAWRTLPPPHILTPAPTRVELCSTEFYKETERARRGAAIVNLIPYVVRIAAVHQERAAAVHQEEGRLRRCPRSYPRPRRARSRRARATRRSRGGPSGSAARRARAR